MNECKFKNIIRNFIVLEGLDGAGTTTQLDMLCSRLEQEGIPAFRTNEPTSGHIGRFIREILGSKITVDPFTLALLFSADRNEHVNGENGIKALAEAGTRVICDRYLFSSLAYQSMDVDFDTVAQLNSFYPLPEHLFFIELSPEECEKRRAARGEAAEIFEKLEFQKKIDANYRKVLELYKDSPMKIHIIDGRLSREEIHRQIFTLLCKDL